MTKKRWFQPVLCLVAGIIVVILLVKLYMPIIIYSDSLLIKSWNFSDNESCERLITALSALAESENITLYAVRTEDASGIHLKTSFKVPYYFNPQNYWPLLDDLEGQAWFKHDLKFICIYIILVVSLLFCIALPMAWLMDRLHQMR